MQCIQDDLNAFLKLLEKKHNRKNNSYSEVFATIIKKMIAAKIHNHDDDWRSAFIRDYVLEMHTKVQPTVCRLLTLISHDLKTTDG